MVRGAPFVYEAFDVTNVDLWLYARTSSLSRERAIVDVKNKNKPQAMERILWIRGLRYALRVDRCIIATTDKREEVKAFGERNNVLVLDGDFLHRVQQNKETSADRVAEEELLEMLTSLPPNKLEGN